MKSTFALVFAAAATLLAGPASANLDLATKKNCMACHAVDKKLVGPSYKEVAAKYGSDKDAVALLSAKPVSRTCTAWRRHRGSAAGCATAS